MIDLPSQNPIQDDLLGMTEDPRFSNLANFLVLLENLFFPQPRGVLTKFCSKRHFSGGPPNLVQFLWATISSKKSVRGQVDSQPRFRPRCAAGQAALVHGRLPQLVVSIQVA